MALNPRREQSIAALKTKFSSPIIRSGVYFIVDPRPICPDHALVKREHIIWALSVLTWTFYLWTGCLSVTGVKSNRRYLRCQGAKKASLVANKTYSITLFR